MTERKKRTPKPVTDLATASVAFKRAQRVADKAAAELEKARQNAEAANKALAISRSQMEHYYETTINPKQSPPEDEDVDASEYSE